jgi:valyl-tRNA synthetase
MPFITEEVWHAMYEGKPPAKSIALVRYPELDQRWLNDQAEEEMLVLQDLIEKVRNMRAEMKVEPKIFKPVAQQQTVTGKIPSWMTTTNAAAKL